MTLAQQVRFVEAELAGSPNDWQLKVFSLILQIPSGHLISYGDLARWANKEFGLQVGPRNTAQLRKRIYGILCHEAGAVTGHETEIPIHRVANLGDLTSARDEPYTQEVNHRRRSAEGSRYSPVWIKK